MKNSAFGRGRISALSDGVFAIALTLLVLNLQAPDVAMPSEPSDFARVLADQLPGFVSWLLSFAILCRLWTVHHDLLAEGDTRSRGFVAWNFVFLGAVSFIPFPTSLLAEHPEQLLSVVVFSLTYVVAGLALGRMRRVGDADAASEHAASSRVRASHAMLLILATALLSCLLALAEPRLGAALWFSYPITGGLVRRRDRRASIPGERWKSRTEIRGFGRLNTIKEPRSEAQEPLDSVCRPHGVPDSEAEGQTGHKAVHVVRDREVDVEEDADEGHRHLQ